MAATAPGPSARRRRDGAVRRIAGLSAILCALAGFGHAPVGSRILFAGDPPVPPSVQAFAWRVIETRCNYQAYERTQRSFWAYHTRVSSADGGVVYSISVVSDLTWKKTDPPAIIEMAVVDDGGLRLEALRSSFVVCAWPGNEQRAAPTNGE